MDPDSAAVQKIHCRSGEAMVNCLDEVLQVQHIDLASIDCSESIRFVLVQRMKNFPTLYENGETIVLSSRTIVVWNLNCVNRPREH